MDDLRITKYLRMKVLNFTKLPPTSSSTILHIKKAYSQANRWYKLLETHNHIDYVYVEHETGWIPQIITEELPPDFPHLRKCKTCAKPNTCICRFCTCELLKCHNDWN